MESQHFLCKEQKQRYLIDWKIAKTLKVENSKDIKSADSRSPTHDTYPVATVRRTGRILSIETNAVF